eukprot:scaffold8008_cov430-Prasinococcus_capsulatus_cf.AAC.5
MEARLAIPFIRVDSLSEPCSGRAARTLRPLHMISIAAQRLRSRSVIRSGVPIPTLLLAVPALLLSHSGPLQATPARA